MHPRALEPARKEGISVRIRNVFNPNNLGTLIIQDGKTKTKDGVKAVTLVRNVAVITVSGAGMVGAPGTAAKVFEDQSLVSIENEIASVKEIFRLQNAQELAEAEKVYLPSFTTAKT